VVAIALIVTGDMEKHGLARSLQKAFPEANFSVQKVDGFTSTKVSWPPPTARGVQSAIEKYVKAFLAALVPGRRDRISPTRSAWRCRGLPETPTLSRRTTATRIAFSAISDAPHPGKPGPAEM
jgi:hypothetical protein